MKKIQVRIISVLLAVVLLSSMVPVTATEAGTDILRETETAVLPVEAETDVESQPEEDAANVVTEAAAVEETADDGIALLALPEETLSGTCGDALTWSLTPAGVLTISGSGAMYDYQGLSTPTPWYDYINVITELVLEEGMTHIGDYAFWSIPSVTELNIPTTVESIGRLACSYMTGITQLDIPQSVTTIGESAFAGCSGLTALVIPDNVTSVGELAFNGCSNVASISIGNGVRYLPYRAFDTNGAVQTIHLSAGVRGMDSSTFDSLTNLVAFTVDADHPDYCVDGNGILYNKDMTRLMYFPGRCLPEDVHTYTIPAHVNNIGDEAFRGNHQIRNLIIPETVKIIGDYAFEDANLLSVSILGCDLMGEAVFRSNPLLESVYVGPNAEEIGDSAFEYCNKLKSVVLEDGITAIGSKAFYRCSALKEITIPSSVESIGDWAFYDCDALSDLQLSEGLERIRANAFSYCDGLRSVRIPDSVTLIDDEAFYKCSVLRKVELSKNLTQIGETAFCHCKALSVIELPESLHTLGKMAFYQSNVKVAVFRGPAPYCKNSSDLFPDNVTIYYMSRYDGKAVDSYTTPWSSPTWREYRTYPVMGDGDLDLQTGGYYNDLKQRHISFISQGKPVYHGTMTVGENSITADEDCDFIATAILAEENQMADFTREGMFALSIPCELLSSFNTVEFYPTDTQEPFVQAAYGSAGASLTAENWYDLLHTGMTITAGSETEQVAFYVDVNWNGFGAGKILLSQNSDGSDGWELAPVGGYCEAANYGPKLRAGLPLYLVLETADGQRFSQKLLVVVKQPKTNIELSTIPDINIGAPEGEEGAHFKGLELGIDLSDSVKFTFALKEDGTLMGMLGFTPPEAADQQEAVYDLVKDSLKSAAPGKDVYSLTEYLVKQHGGIVDIPKSAKMMVKVENQILGYMEGRYVQQADGTYKPVFTEGAIAVKVEGEASYVYQTYLPPPASVPFYIKPSMGASMQLTLPVMHNSSTGKLKALPVRMTIEVPLRIAGGLGWESILSVGIYGEGKATIEGEITNQESTAGYLEASFGAEAAVFCFAADVTIAKTDPWYFLGNPKMTLLAYESIRNTWQQAEWKMQSRDYLDAPTLSEISLLEAEEESAGLTASAVTADPVYPYADVQIARYGDKLVAVWVGDDPNREDANRTALYYSVSDSDGQQWSNPAVVKNDGTADFDPILMDANGTLYVIWKNASRALTAEDTVDTIPGTINLQYGWFRESRNRFQDITTIDVAGNYDTCAQLAQTDNGLAVVWVSTEAAGVFGSEDAAYSIYRKCGSQQQEVLASGLGYIDGLAAYGNDIWFTADTDGDCTTMHDRELFSISGGEIIQITDDAVSDASPFIANGTLGWYRDGVLCLAEKEISVPADATRSCYAAGDGMEAILYVQDDAVRKSTLYAIFNEGSGWGEPVNLTGITGNIGSLDAVFAADGSLSILVCERVLDSTSDNYLADAAYLRHYTMNAVCDLAVTGVSYLAQTMIPNGELTLAVDVENRGMCQAQMIQLSAAYGAETTESVVMFAELPSGDNRTMFLNLPLPADLSTVGQISVTAVVMDREEGTPDDNTAYTNLRLSDLSVENAKAISDGETTKATVLISNRGRTVLSGINLQVLEDETVLAETTVDTLGVDEGQFVTLEIELGMEHLSLLNIQATAAGLNPEQENISSNNDYTVLVDGPKAPIFSVTRTAMATDTGAIASAEIYNGTAESRTCTLCAAAYNKDGKMLDVAFGTYETTAGESRTVPMDLGGGSAVTEVRVFLLDAACVPAETETIITVR